MISAIIIGVSLIFGVVLNAVGDGFLDEGRAKKKRKKMRLGHLLRAIGIGLPIPAVVVADPEVYQAGYIAASYVLFRIGLFNIAYNIIRKLPLSYVGETDVSDSILGKVPPFGRITLYVFGMLVGVGVIYTMF